MAYRVNAASLDLNLEEIEYALKQAATATTASKLAVELEIISNYFRNITGAPASILPYKFSEKFSSNLALAARCMCEICNPGDEITA